MLLFEQMSLKNSQKFLISVLDDIVGQDYGYTFTLNNELAQFTFVTVGVCDHKNQVLIDIVEIITALELHLVLLGFTGFYWVLLGFTGFYRVLLEVTGSYWVFTGFYWV